MIYIQIPEKQDAKGFLLLAKSAFPVVCLPENTYGVREEHLKLLSASESPLRSLKRAKSECQSLRWQYERTQDLLAIEIQ